MSIPQAPKGGELRLVSNLRTSTFDKYNPFTIKGNAPAYLANLMFDTLLVGSLDETASGYGLLAEDVVVAADGLSATFRLRPEARFHNGDPVLAADVKHSYDTLIGKFTSPGYKTLLEDVAGLDVLDDRTVRYRFKKPNRELPLTVGGLPVFSRKWGMENGKAKPFDQVVMDIPIGSGPYKIGPVQVRQGHHLCARPGLLGARPQRQARHLQLRPHHRQDLQGQHRPPGGTEGGRVRPDALLLGRRLGPARHWQAVRHRRTGQGRIQAPAALRLPELCAQHPQATSSRTCVCAKPWAWRWTTSG